MEPSLPQLILSIKIKGSSWEKVEERGGGIGDRPINPCRDAFVRGYTAKTSHLGDNPRSTA
jgi:hypothetical protein